MEVQNKKSPCFFFLLFFTYSFSVFSVLLCENFAVVLIFFRTFSWLLGVLGESDFPALSSTEQIYIIIYIFFFRNKTPPVSSANFHKSHNSTRHQEKALGVSCLSQYQLSITYPIRACALWVLCVRSVSLLYSVLSLFGFRYTSLCTQPTQELPTHTVSHISY